MKGKQIPSSLCALLSGAALPRGLVDCPCKLPSASSILTNLPEILCFLCAPFLTVCLFTLTKLDPTFSSAHNPCHLRSEVLVFSSQI